MITIHLTGIGAHRFTGPQAAAHAQHWLGEQLACRDADFADRAKLDDATWRALQGEAAEEILEQMQARRRATTVEIVEATGYARSTVSRVMCGFATLGKIRDLGQPNGKAPKTWEIAE